MFINLKIISFEVIIVVFYCYGQSSTRSASGDKSLNVQSWVSLPHETKTLLQRQKRHGGGGAIPFRPLFVYRQQQRKMQQKWKEIEERKKLRQLQQLQYHQYEQYQDSMKPYQLTYRPATYYSSYKYPYAYSSYNYPSTRYNSYTYPSYYYSRDKYPTYQSDPPYYDSEYYDGYEYSYL